jgi:hypothetical protein
MIPIYSKLSHARSRGVVGLTCGPVKAEIAGSSPVGTAGNFLKKPGNLRNTPGFIYSLNPAKIDNYSLL